MKKKVAFCTLGCKVNYCETESLQALFTRAGYTVTDFENPADVYVINTCTVTGISDHKSRKMIRRARSRAPEAVIVATGCYAQGSPEAVKELGQVDLVIGTHGREKLPRLVEQARRDRTTDLVRPFPRKGAAFEALPFLRQRGRTRGFLKIQEGCSQDCSYCIVPVVRGPLRSLSPEKVLSRARSMVRAGSREIVLTGIHLGHYGADLEEVTLAGLIGRIEAEVPGLVRIRLSSLEPADITGELVDTVVSSAVVCPHLHIPLQSGDGEILKLMNRPYTPSEYLYLVRWLKQQKPDLAISTDVIVGFPGETEKHHRRSMKLVREAAFSSLHVFQFSPRPGTAAADFPARQPREIKEKRSREMMALSEKLSSGFRKKFIGAEQQVLVEKVEPGAYGEGFTEHYLRVRVALDGKGRGWRGKLIAARLETVEDHFIWAVPVRQT